MSHCQGNLTSCLDRGIYITFPPRGGGWKQNKKMKMGKSIKKYREEKGKKEKKNKMKKEENKR